MDYKIFASCTIASLVKTSMAVISHEAVVYKRCRRTRSCHSVPQVIHLVALLLLMNMIKCSRATKYYI